MATVHIGGVRVSIAGQDAGFVSTMKRVGAAFDRQQRQLQRARRNAAHLSRTFGELKRSLAGLVAGVAGGLGIRALISTLKEAGRSSAEFGSTLVEIASASGLTVRRLQAIRFAFESDGVSAEKADRAIGKVARAFGDVENLKTYQRAFEQIGVEWATLQAEGATIDDVVNAVANGIANTTDKAKLAAAASQLLGRDWQQAVRALQGGSQVFADAEKYLENIGALLSDADAENLKAMNQALAEIQKYSDIQMAKMVSENTDAFIAAAKASVDLKLAWLDLINSGKPLIELMVTIVQNYRDYIKFVKEAAAPGLVDDHGISLSNAVVAARERLDAAQNALAEMRLQSIAATGMHGTEVSPGEQAQINNLVGEVRRLTAAWERAKQAAADYRDEQRLISGDLAPGDGRGSHDGGSAAPGSGTRLIVPIHEPPGRSFGDSHLIESRDWWEEGLDRRDHEAARLASMRAAERQAREDDLRARNEAAATALNELSRIEEEYLQRIMDEQQRVAQSIQSRFAAVTSQLREGLLSTFSGVLVGRIDDIKGAMHQLALSIAEAALQAYAFQALTNAAGGGGPFGQILSSLGFGGRGGIPGAAAGRPVQRGQPYHVGEFGPELFIPAERGRIEPYRGGASSDGSMRMPEISISVDARGQDGPSARAAVLRAFDEIAPRLQQDIVNMFSRPTPGRSAVFRR